MSRAGAVDRVATLTLNPAIDSASEAEQVFPTHKVRIFGERYDPGGGGINVARALARLKVPTEAVYLAGGATGALLDDLLARQDFTCQRVPIHDQTRMSMTVFERATGHEFRFVPEGPVVRESEWRAALDLCAGLGCQWLVASGSLPRGVPDDFLVRLHQRLSPRGIKLLVDCSGAGLAQAVMAGGLFLAKPSHGEFEALAGRKFSTPAEIGEAALAMVQAGKVQHLAITLGHEGAVLAHPGGIEFLAAPKVEVRSATGAGDSFLAGMLHGFLRGDSAVQAFRRGVAAGSAAVLTPGTDLCQPEDIERLLREMR